MLGLVAVAAILALVLLVTSGDPKPSTVATTPNVSGVRETAALLDGVPQRGFTIGDPKAPITLLEYVDLQCPYCKIHQLETTPTLVKELVRTGEAQISLVPLAFLGPDSVKARNVLLRLARQNRAWEFANLFYWNQGEENSGYVTPSYVADLVANVPGAAKADASLEADPEDAELATGADRLGQAVLTKHEAGTPGFAIGPSSAPLPSFTWIPVYQEEPAADQLIAAVRKLRKRLDSARTAAGTA